MVLVESQIPMLYILNLFPDAKNADEKDDGDGKLKYGHGPFCTMFSESW